MSYVYIYTENDGISTYTLSSVSNSLLAFDLQSRLLRQTIAAQHNINSPTMDSTNTQPKNRSFHTLRTTSLLLWIPTLAFCLPHGIIAHVLFPVLGIIPMTFSALLALLHLSKRTQPARSVSVLLDILCACSLIAVLVPSWVSLARGSRNFYWDRPLSGITMIGTYATGVMMVNL